MTLTLGLNPFKAIANLTLSQHFLKEKDKNVHFYSLAISYLLSQFQLQRVHQAPQLVILGFRYLETLVPFNRDIMAIWIQISWNPCTLQQRHYGDMDLDILKLSYSSTETLWRYGFRYLETLVPFFNRDIMAIWIQMSWNPRTLQQRHYGDIDSDILKPSYPSTETLWRYGFRYLETLKPFNRDIIAIWIQIPWNPRSLQQRHYGDMDSDILKPSYPSLTETLWRYGFRYLETLVPFNSDIMAIWIQISWNHCTLKQRHYGDMDSDISKPLYPSTKTIWRYGFRYLETLVPFNRDIIAIWLKSWLVG